CDKTIKMWDIESETILYSLTQRYTAVALCALKNGGFVTGCSDGTIRIWNALGECVNRIYGHPGDINCVIELNNGLIASASSVDGSIKIWSLDGDCIQILKEHRCVIFLTELRDGVIISGSMNG